MRRAMRHVYFLNIREPILYNLVKKVIELMKDAYPELSRAEKLASVTVFMGGGMISILPYLEGIKIFNDENIKIWRYF